MTDKSKENTNEKKRVGKLKEKVGLRVQNTNKDNKEIKERETDSTAMDISDKVQRGRDKQKDGKKRWIVIDHCEYRNCKFYANNGSQIDYACTHCKKQI
jgi:hypothetical protein